MQGSPFCSIVPLGQKLLSLSFYCPRLQSSAFVRGARFMHFPDNLTTSISTDPLAIEINIDVDIEVPLDIYGQI